MDTYFKESHYILTGRKKPTEILHWRVMGLLHVQTKHLSIDWAHRYPLIATNEEGTVSWSNTVARDTKNMNILWCHIKSKGAECTAFLLRFTKRNLTLVFGNKQCKTQWMDMYFYWHVLVVTKSQYSSTRWLNPKLTLDSWMTESSSCFYLTFKTEVSSAALSTHRMLYPRCDCRL